MTRWRVFEVSTSVFRRRKLVGEYEYAVAVVTAAELAKHPVGYVQALVDDCERLRRPQVRIPANSMRDGAACVDLVLELA